MLDRYEVVLFDFDGTILKTDDAITLCALQTLCQRGLSVEEGVQARIQGLIGTGATLDRTFRELGLSESEIPAAIDHYRELYAREGDNLCCLYEGVGSALSALSERGPRLALLSNKGHAAVVRAVAQFGLSDYFQFVAGERDGIKPKPNPDFFHAEIVPYFNLTPQSRVLMVGDTVADIEFARAIGGDSCWVTWGFGDRSACTALSPAYVVERMDQVVEVVAGR